MDARGRRKLRRELERKYGEELNLRRATARLLGQDAVVINLVRFNRVELLGMDRFDALRQMQQEERMATGLSPYSIVVDDSLTASRT